MSQYKDEIERARASIATDQGRAKLHRESAIMHERRVEQACSRVVAYEVAERHPECSEVHVDPSRAIVTLLDVAQAVIPPEQTSWLGTSPEVGLLLELNFPLTIRVAEHARKA